MTQLFRLSLSKRWTLLNFQRESNDNSSPPGQDRDLSIKVRARVRSCAQTRAVYTYIFVESIMRNSDAKLIPNNGSV